MHDNDAAITIAIVEENDAAESYVIFPCLLPVNNMLRDISWRQPYLTARAVLRRETVEEQWSRFSKSILPAVITVRNSQRGAETSAIENGENNIIINPASCNQSRWRWLRKRGATLLFRRSRPEALVAYWRPAKLACGVAGENARRHSKSSMRKFECRRLIDQ